VFFDGEEAVPRWSPTDGQYGSRHFAQRLAEDGAQHLVKAAIVIDMIGDAHLDIQRERLNYMADGPRFQPSGEAGLRALLRDPQQEN
jgi:hypothetical protein